MLTYCLFFAITVITGVLAGQATLEPAFTLQIGVENGIPIGPVVQGYGLSYTVCPNGTIISAPGAAVPVNASIITASDTIHMDPDGKRVRLGVNGVAKTTSGTIFRFGYTGIITPDEAVAKIMSRAPDMQTTGFGTTVSDHTFEIPVAAPELAGLNNNVFVGAGRFIVNGDRSVTVEYVASRVVAVD